MIRIARAALAGLSLAIVGLSNGAHARAGTARGSLPGPTVARTIRPVPDASREWWSVGVHAVDAHGGRYTIVVRYFRFTLGRGDDLDSAELFVLDDATQRSEQTSVSARATRGEAASPRNASFAAGDWSLDAPVGGGSHAVTMRAGSHAANVEVALELVPQKPAVRSLATRDGTSITRLWARGTLTWAGKRIDVSGRAWFDHDRESARDGPSGRIGWERFELQFDDGRDVELFASRLRNDRYRVRAGGGATADSAGERVGDGTRIPVAGIVVSAAGRETLLGRFDAELVWDANTLWRSGATDAAYPSLWSLTIPHSPRIAILDTALAQELRPSRAGVAVWSGGAAIAEADPPGRPLGDAFVELTGFAVPSGL